MIDLLLGMIGAILLFAAMVVGFHLGRMWEEDSTEDKKTEPTPELTPEEKEEIRQARETIKAENEAWGWIAGYTPSKAYGIGSEKIDGEKEEGRQ